MTSKCKKSQIWPFRPWKMTFRAIQPNLSFDMWFMSPKRSFMPKKKKSYWSVSEIDPSPPQSWWTDRQMDGQTDGQSALQILQNSWCDGKDHRSFQQTLLHHQVQRNLPQPKSGLCNSMHQMFTYLCWPNQTPNWRNVSMNTSEHTNKQKLGTTLLQG